MINKLRNVDSLSVWHVYRCASCPDTTTKETFSSVEETKTSVKPPPFNYPSYNYFFKILVTKLSGMQNPSILCFKTL